MCMTTQFFQIECKATKVDGGVKIKGFASTPDIDRYDDIVSPYAFTSGLKNFVKNPVMLRSHNPDEVIGKFMVDGQDAPVVSDAGLAVTGVITDEEIGKKALNGEMQAMSIGFIAKEVEWKEIGTGKFYDGIELKKQIRIIKDLDLIEISIVSTPANPNALFTVEKSVKNYLQSLPNSIMQNNCSVYPELKAKFKLGDRYLSQKAVDEMELKGDEPLEEIEAVEDTATEIATENNETSGETPQPVTTEEVVQKVEEVEPATEEKAVVVEQKANVDFQKSFDQVTSLIKDLAEQLKKTNEELATLKALAQTPVQKSKTLHALQPSGAEKLDKATESFMQLFANAKNAKVTQI